MTTVSIPLTAFTLSTFVPPATPPTLNSTGPFGFNNAGDGLRTSFDMYEFGGLIPSSGGLLQMELEYMEIRLPEVGLPGDFNGNHVVDAADYTLWRDNLGATEGSLLGGNGNGGVVDATDYALWKQHFGESNGAGSGGISSVPEPGTIALMALGLLAMVGRRERLI